MNDSLPEPPDSLTRQLLDYWIQHPEAQSTAEAMAEWWLLEQQIRQTVAEVRHVLDQLVKKGFAVEQRQPDGRISYKLSREKEGEIRAWLASRGREES